MKKLSLNIDALKVQTFQTLSEDGSSSGTVLGADGVHLMGTRVTRCYSECNACTYTNCNPEQRTEIDCIC